MADETENNSSKVETLSEEELSLKQSNLNEQCYLIDNYEYFFNIPRSGDIGSKSLYKHLTKLNGTPARAIQSLVGRYGIESLIDITPAQLALLVPKIQVYQVNYKSPDDNAGEEYEFKFNDHTSQKSIEAMTQGRLGRGDDVGIKSFSYSLKGKSEADAGMVESELKIFFQNIESLVSEETQFLKLIFQSPKYNIEDQSAKVYSPDYFRLKIVTGWSDPVDPQSVIMTEGIKKAIKRSRETMFLNLRDHSIDFRDNGGVELTVSYISMIQKTFNDRKMDIFSPFGEGSKAEKMRQDLSKVKTAASGPSVEEKKKTASILGVNEEKIGSLTDEKINELKKQKEIEITQMEMKDKQIKYSRLLNALLKSKKIFVTTVSPEMVQAFSDEQEKRAKELIDEGKLKSEDVEAEKQRILEYNRKKNVANLNHKQIDDIGGVNVINKGLEAIKKANDLKIDKDFDFSKTAEKRTEAIQSVVNSNNFFDTDCKGCKKIHFFYLGDLIDIALDIVELGKINKTQNVRVIIGSMEFVDPGDPGYDQTTGTFKNKRTYNMADIPISLNLFMTWFMEIIKRDEPRMFIGHFIERVVRDLVVPAFSSDSCFIGSGILKKYQSVEPKVNYFSVPVRNINKGDFLTVENLEEINKKEFDKDYRDVKDLMNIVYIYSFGPYYGRGIREEDHKNGVYHLTMGSDKGLVKEIKFNRVDQPEVRAMRVTADSELSKKARNVYNATIRMVGNSLFRLGNYIFIDTSKFANTSKLGNSAKSNSISSKLGLGGYYCITAIDNSIEENGYETILKATWNSTGDANGVFKNVVERIKEHKEKSQEKADNARKSLSKQ